MFPKRDVTRFLRKGRLLNSNVFTVETFGLDNSGKRTLTTMHLLIEHTRICEYRVR